MRLSRSFFAAVVAFGLVPATIWSCSKDKDDDDAAPAPVAPVTAETKADAGKASQAAFNALPTGNGANLRHAGARLKVRQLYAQGLAHERMLTQDGDADPQVDICSLLIGSCDQLSKQPPSLDEGSTCAVTCPKDSIAISCTDPAFESSCKDVKYSFTNMTTASAMTCASNADGSFTMAIDAEVSTEFTGGSVTKASKLECKFNLSMTQNPTADDDSAAEDEELELDCNKMSCKVDGTAMTCDELKAAMADQSCDAGA